MVLIPWTSFTLYGKVWLLTKDDALFGEGKLTLSTEGPSMSGYVRMFVGIPDAKGSILSFDGKIAFMYSGAEKYIKSEKLNGLVMRALKAEGIVDITEKHILLKGSLRYDLDKKLSLGVVDFYLNIHASASGSFFYDNPKSSLTADAGFDGSIDLKGDFPFFGMSTLVAGSVHLDAKLAASPGSIKLSGKVHVDYSVFGYSDSLDLDAGYEG